MLVWPLVGQANSSLLPFLLSLPAQKPEQRGPRDPNNARQTASLSSARTDSGWTSTAGPAEAGRLALWGDVSRTSGRPCSALGLTACPVALQATALCYTLPARSAKSAAPAPRFDRRPSSEPNGEDTDRLAGPAPGDKAGAPACCKASRPAQDLVSLARRQTNRARQIDFAPFGTGMKDANRAEAQRAVIYSAAETTPAPASQDPRCGCTLHNARCALSPVGSVTVSARLLPGPQGQPAVTAPVPPASFTPAPHSAGLVS